MAQLAVARLRTMRSGEGTTGCTGASTDLRVREEIFCSEEIFCRGFTTEAFAAGGFTTGDVAGLQPVYQSGVLILPRGRAANPIIQACLRLGAMQGPKAGWPLCAAGATFCWMQAVWISLSRHSTRNIPDSSGAVRGLAALQGVQAKAGQQAGCLAQLDALSAT